MSKRILYKNAEGGVSIIIPAVTYILNNDAVVDENGIIITPATAHLMTVEEIAVKDVPTGVPFKIVDTTEAPSDRTFRDAWEVDEVEMTDGLGA